MAKKKPEPFGPLLPWQRQAMARFLGAPLHPTPVYPATSDFVNLIALTLTTAELAGEPVLYLEIAGDVFHALRAGYGAQRVGRAGGVSIFGVPAVRSRDCWRRCRECSRSFNLACETCEQIAPMVRSYGTPCVSNYPGSTAEDLADDLEDPGDEASIWL